MLIKYIERIAPESAAALIKYILDGRVGRGVVNRCGRVSRQRCWKNVTDTGEPAAGTNDESVACVDEAGGGDLLTYTFSSTTWANAGAEYC